MLKISVANLLSRRLPIKEIRQIAERVLIEEGIEEGEVSVVLAGDELLLELNRKYRGVDKTTDVLAFPFEEEECLGEVIISVDAARDQARAYGHSIKEEIKILLVHGILHLIGYDHEVEEEASKMQARERGIIEGIG
jgi:probable rRNA maturation factor